jgi:hypothetical protein
VVVFEMTVAAGYFRVISSVLRPCYATAAPLISPGTSESSATHRQLRHRKCHPLFEIVADTDNFAHRNNDFS